MRSSMHAERVFSRPRLLSAAIPLAAGIVPLVVLGLGLAVESLQAAVAIAQALIAIFVAYFFQYVRSGHRDLDARLTEVVARELAGDAAFKRSVDALASDVANGIERPAGSLEERLRRRDP